MKAWAGYSTKEDTVGAVKEALYMACGGDDETPAILFVFTTDRYDPEVIVETITQSLDGVPVSGMSAAGIIFGEKVFRQGIAILGIGGSSVEATSVLQKDLSQRPFEAGREAGDKLLSYGFDNGVVTVFPDGFSSNISEMLRGLYMNMGPEYQYMGGGAGDNLNFFKTYQFTEKGVATDAIALGLIRGAPINISVGHGWKTYGDPIMVTRTEGKRVYEIDGKPAFDAYKDRFKDISVESFSNIGMRYPLGFLDVNGGYYIRDLLSVNPEDHSINCVSEVPENAIGNIMQGDVSDLINTAKKVCTNAKNEIPNPGFALICDCISRYLLMEDKFENELAAFRQIIGSDTPMVGALTFGEVGSVDYAPFFHNKTVVLAIG